MKLSPQTSIRELIKTSQSSIRELLRTPSSSSHPEDTQSPNQPEDTPSLPVIEAPPVEHHVYGVYWLNDNSVAVIMSDRYDEKKRRVLALNIHGGFDWISLPYSNTDCIFQQVKGYCLF